MVLWRICREKFADLSGRGASLLGGRWNSPGRPVVYAAEAAALAVLEVRVHLDLDWSLLPNDYVLLEIDAAAAEIEQIATLPADTIAAGDAWLSSGRTAILQVPSLIVPESRNLLINPLHPDAANISIASSRAFAFDHRLWRSN